MQPPSPSTRSTRARIGAIFRITSGNVLEQQLVRSLGKGVSL